MLDCQITLFKTKKNQHFRTKLAECSINWIAFLLDELSGLCKDNKYRKQHPAFLAKLKFIEKESDPSNRIWAYSEALSSKSGLLIDMNFVLTDEAEVNIIFDETLGDKITAKGSGAINIGVNSSKEVYMFGDYTLSKGDYLFTLQNFVNKKFEIVFSFVF